MAVVMIRFLKIWIIDFENLLLFSVLYHAKLNMFELLAGQNNIRRHHFGL